MLNIVLEQVTAALELRSALPRQRYLARLEEALQRAPRQRLGCSNLAHVLAAQPDATRLIIKQGGAANIAIISSYNEMLSAHAPFHEYPVQLKLALAKAGAGRAWSGSQAVPSGRCWLRPIHHSWNQPTWPSSHMGGFSSGL